MKVPPLRSPQPKAENDTAKLKEMFTLFWSLGDIKGAQEVLEKLKGRLGGQSWFEARVEVCLLLEKKMAAQPAPLFIRSALKNTDSA